VVFPLKRWISSKVVLILISITWLVSIIINAVLLRTLGFHQTADKLYCFSAWNSRGEFLIYIFTVIVTNILLPIGLITFAYIAIFRKLKRQVIVLGDSISDQQRVQESMRQKRIVYMAFAIVCCFAVCWLPFALQMILQFTVFLNTVKLPCSFLRFREVSYYFLVLISVTNPAICFAFGTAS